MRTFLALALAALLHPPLAQSAAPRWVEGKTLSDKIETGFDASACTGDPSGRAYVGLSRLVFGFSDIRMIGGTVDRYYERHSPGAPLRRIGRSVWPEPPDAAQPDGCLQHPAQRDNYELDGAPLAALLDIPRDLQHPDGAVGGDAVFLRPDGGGSLHDGPLSRSRDDWTKPTSPDVPPVRFSCADRCMIRAIFEPGLFLLAYHRVNAASPVPPIEQMTDFQQRLWRGLRRAEIRNYQWAMPRQPVAPAP